MASEVYIYINSSSFESYFPSNKPSSFTALLPETLHFEGPWEVAIVQIKYPKSSKSQEVVLLTDFTEDMMFCENKKPILRKFPIIAKGKSITFNVPFYKPVKSKYLDQISLHILDEEGDYISFGGKTLSCTLHFQKCLWTG